MIGIDLAEDKQALAVIDHDVRVLARKTVKVKAFRLGEALDWAVAAAKVKGFTHVTVACEPTGPRWMQVQRLRAERCPPLVCIQPLMFHIARDQQSMIFGPRQRAVQLVSAAAGRRRRSQRRVRVLVPWMMTGAATSRQIGSECLITLRPIRAQVSPPRDVLPAQGVVALFPEKRNIAATTRL